MIGNLKNLTNTENKKRLFSNFMSLSVLRGFQFLIPLITLPYLVRTIGIENFGLVNFALSLGLYFGAIIQFGFGITATRETARHRDDPNKLAKIYSVTLSASVILALISAIFFSLIVISVEKFNAYLSLYLFTLAFVVFQSLFPIWFFQGMEKMKYITFLSLGMSLIYLVSLFLFIKHEEDFFLVPLLQAIAAMIMFVLAIVVIHKQFKISFKTPQWVEIKIAYQEGRHAFIVQLAPNLYNNSAVFLLGLFTNNTVVGLYTAATKVIEALKSFGMILTSTFLPYLSRTLNKHNAFIYLMVTSGALLTIFAIVFSGFIVNLLYGESNSIVSQYILLLSPWILLIFTRNALGVNYLMLTGYEKEYKNIILYSSITSFLMALILIPYFEIMGAIASVNIAALLMAAFTINKYLKVKND